MFRRVCFSFSRASILPQPLKPKSQFPLSTSKLRSFNSSPKMGEPHKPKITVPALDKATRPELLRAIETAVGSPFTSGPTRPAPPPILIVISGPSGVGKDAVIKKLREQREKVHFVVTATSRPMRPGEVHGKDYYFVSKDEFLNMVERNELLEYALVYGDYKGIPNWQIRENLDSGFDVVVRVDIQGADTLRRKLGDSAVFVFLVAESELKLVERLIDRKTEKVEELATRIAAAKVEMQCMSNFDYVVVNAEGKLDEAVRLLGSIIDSEKARVFPRKATI